MNTTTLVYCCLLLLILRGMHVLAASPNQILNLTFPINQLLLQNNQNRDVAHEEIIRKLFVGGRDKFLYSTVLDNDTFELFSNVTQLMDEIVPGSSDGLQFQLDQTRNDSLDLNAAKSTMVRWARKRNNSNDESHNNKKSLTSSRIGVYVNWDTTTTGCIWWEFSKGLYPFVVAGLGPYEGPETYLKQYSRHETVADIFALAEIPTYIAYNSKDIRCSNHLLWFVASQPQPSSFLMLTIDFEVEEGAHHIFDAFVSDTMLHNEVFLRDMETIEGRQVTRPTLMYSFNLLLPSESRIAGDDRDRDLILFHKLTESWAAAAAGKDPKLVIINTFNTNLTRIPTLLRMIAEEEERRGYPRNLVIPLVGVGPRRNDDFKIPAAALLCEVATRFDAVEVDTQIWNQLFEAGLITCMTNTSERTPPKLNVYHVLQNETRILPDNNNNNNNNHPFSSHFNASSSSTGVMKNKNLRQVSVLLQYPKHSNNNNNNVGSFFRGCYIRFGSLPEPNDDTTEYVLDSLVNLTTTECSALLHDHQFSYVVWEFDLTESDFRNIASYTKLYTSQYNQQLAIISSQINLFVKTYPGTQIALKLDQGHYSRTFDAPGCISSFDDRQFRSTVMVLLNWAYVQNVTLFLNTNSDAGFADALLKKENVQRYVPELELPATKWPEFVSRDYPSNYDGFYPWTQDPCPTTVYDIPGYSIPIDFGLTGGATLNLMLREKPLRYTEVQTLLQFSLHRFSRLEIVIERAADVRPLGQALSPEFLKFVEGNGPKMVYICISNVQLLHEDGMRLMVNSIHSSLQTVGNISLGGVHVYSPPGIEDMNRHIAHLKQVVGKNDNDVRVGLFLNQSEVFVANLFNSTSNEDQQQQQQQLISPKIDYLVCSVPTTTTADKKEDPDSTVAYSDIHWYIARVLKRRFSNLAVHFKDLSSPNQEIGNVNLSVNLAKLHSLNYFVVNVVSTKSEASNNNKLGWWKIVEYSDLDDRQVYQQRDAKYYSGKTWVPPVFQNTEQPIFPVVAKKESLTFFQKWSTWIIVGPIVAVLLINAIAFGVWIGVLRRRVDYLSSREVYEFRQGGAPPLEPGMELDLYSTLKYNSSYEISKGELNLDSATLLGMGNFGQVRKANVKGSLAAIKSPHDNCSKESFKGMLIEVKVMCHLGAHPNLVELIGCHTSEIGRGMIYIVTALCENGSLESCLRRSKDDVVQFQDMVMFAHEIACGMDYIAGKNVVHGDLATRNVLLDSHNICKIGDFGLSRKLYEYSMYVKQSQEPLPWRWMAYESLFKMEFTSMSDVWSYGITLWEIFSLGAVPYPGLQWTVGFVDELKTGLRMNTPELATPEIYNMMLRCWSLEPKVRPTFRELVDFFIPFRDAEYECLGD